MGIGVRRFRWLVCKCVIQTNLQVLSTPSQDKVAYATRYFRLIFRVIIVDLQFYGDKQRVTKNR